MLLRLVAESLPNGVLVVDHNRGIVLANQQIERQFDYCRNDLLGQSIDLLLPEGGLTESSQTIGLEQKLSGRRRDGLEFPIAVTLSPLKVEQGLFTLVSVVDLTERQRARAGREPGDRSESGVRATHCGTLGSVHQSAGRSGDRIDSRRDSPDRRDARRGSLQFLQDHRWRAARSDRLVGPTRCRRSYRHDAVQRSPAVDAGHDSRRERGVLLVARRRPERG